MIYNIPMIDFRKLEVFLKVYETRSFSKASKLLYLTQPTITLHIKDLEEVLGVKLLNRSTRKVIPSKAGKVVYEYGKEIIKFLKEMERELEIFKNEERGIIEIGGSTIPGQYILPKIIKTFKEKYPKISIFLKVGDSKEIIEKVIKGDFDLGMVGAIFKSQRDLVFKPCYEDEIVLIAPSDFPREEIKLEELYKIPLIKREEGSGTWKNALETLEKKGLDVLKLNIIGEMGSTEAIKEAVKNGLGCGFVSSLAIELERKLNLIKIIKIKGISIKRKFYFIYPKVKKLTSSEEKFIGFIKNVFNLS
ncbi:MAG: LysR family transcriptional regulator [Thermodesulfobacterium geofontis]|uniref:LysR family transcriptional regulator n=1 Tax=Thermodesulfobacterium geofontis TaxID=1295609 RepID=A0A2N7PPV7_9BACT|nr:MAG: LysR family transcriptional regulator [Thermodesulfobacterium geofontis]